MIIRKHSRYPLSALVLFLLSAVAEAQDSASPFDCHITYDNAQYDLTSLAGVHTLQRERDTPPSKMVDTVTFNLCADLTQLEGVDEADQCPSGTRACLTKTNSKGSAPDRIVAVIPLANSSAVGMEYSTLTSPTGISLTFKGPSYPSSSSSTPIPQSFNVRLLCATEQSEAQFSSYDGKLVSVEWSTPAGCKLSGNGDAPSGGDTPAHDGDGSGDIGSDVGSGIGYFFLLLLLAFAAYFGLGAYYNYTTYGASGADLIPHRDFWREVPYMLRDVVSHLCSAVRPRQSSRGGYVAV